MESKYMLAALDLGGTKSDAVLFNEHGDILHHIIDPGGTPLDIGLEPAVANYTATLNRLFSQTDRPIDALYCGVACSNYCHGQVGKMLGERMTRVNKFRIEGDGPCLISGMLGHRDGASMICGTGSSVCVRRGEESHHLGGWGYLIDSCGSGYVLGRNAIQRALRACDGRLPPTMMTDLLAQACGEPIWQHIDRLYAGGRPYIASLSSVVFAARAMGDPAATEIFNQGAADLAALAFAAYRELQKPFDLVFNGGVFTHHPEYAAAVRGLCPEAATVIISTVPPVYGGAVEALATLGLTPDEDFRLRFLAGYEKPVC